MALRRTGKAGTSLAILLVKALRRPHRSIPGGLTKPRAMPKLTITTDNSMASNTAKEKIDFPQHQEGDNHPGFPRPYGDLMRSQPILHCL